MNIVYTASMRWLRYIAPVSFGMLCLVQNAHACGSYSYLSKADVAFAEVIFEGEIRNIYPEVVYNEHFGKNQIRGMELEFSVDKVIRGQLRTDLIRVGWNHSTNGYPKSLEEFVTTYGKNVRVGLTTPEQFETFCRIETRTWTNSVTKETSESNFPVCDYSITAFGEVNSKNIPFVMNAHCTGPYMFKLDGDQEPQAFEPWIYEKSSPKNVAVDLFREKPELFTPKLKEDVYAQYILLERALEIAPTFKPAWEDEERHERRAKSFEEALLASMVSIVKLTEKDPKFRERLLESGEAD